MNKDYDNIKIPDNLDDYISTGLEKAKYDINNNNNINIEESDNMKFNKMNLSKVAIIALVLGGTLTLTNESTLANIKSFIENPSNLEILLNGRSNLEDYTTVVNTTVSDKGVDVTLKEVILDPATNELHVLTYIHSEFINYDKELNKAYHNFFMDFTEIYINGKIVNTSGSATQRHVDDNVIESLQSFNLDKNIDLSGDIDLKMRNKQASYTDYSAIVDYIHLEGEEYLAYEDFISETIDKAKAKKIKGTWDFEFTVNGDALAMTTNIIPINQELVFYDEILDSVDNVNNFNITLGDYIANDVSQKIMFTIDYFNILGKNAILLDLELVGVDNLGNNISFYNSSISSGVGTSGVGTFEMSNSGIGIEEGVEYLRNVSPDAEFITLKLYYRVSELESGVIRGDYTILDDEIIIYLNK